MLKINCFRYKLVVCQPFYSTLRRKNLYEILQIDQNASQIELKNAFYKLSKKYHPDVVNSLEASSKKFVEIFNAYETLKDEQKRSEYDNLIRTKRNQNTQLHSLSKSKRNCYPEKQQNSSAQTNPSSSNFKIYSMLNTKETNPFFDNLMKEDAWRRTKIFGICFILFLLIYFVFVRLWYIKK